NALMHSSEGPACDGAAGVRSNAAPVTGAAPFTGNEPGAAPMEAAGAAPFTGGKAGSFRWGAARPGSGAGNAACAKPGPAWTVTTATVSGTIRRRMIKMVSPARSKGRQRLPDGRTVSDRAFYDSCRPLTTRGIWQQRGVEPRRTPIIALI